MMQERDIRTAYLLGNEGVERLKKARVAVFGIGGVGSFCAEALVRMGVGHLTFIDHDTVSQSNLNRQLIALYSTVGQNKAEVMRRRALDINREVDVTALDLFYLPEKADQFDVRAYDCIVDAIDTVSAKIDLVVRAKAAGVPIVSSMGTGNKTHPELLTLTDISKTSECPLARVMRRELRARGIDHLTCVYSPEKPIPLHPDFAGDGETNGDLRSSGPESPVEIIKKPSPGTVSFVPSAAGLLLASAVFRILTDNAEPVK